MRHTIYLILLACGGQVSEPLQVPAAADGYGSLGSVETPQQEQPPTPVYPPYGGPVTTTDVSFLYPLPETGAQGLLSPTEGGSYGPLLSTATFAVQGVWDASEYLNLRVVGVRISCSIRRYPNICVPMVRVVFQPIHLQPTGAPTAVDGALQATYNLANEQELFDLMTEILDLRRANGSASDVLGVHPILAHQGLSGRFAQGLQGIWQKHLGETRMRNLKFLGHARSERWTFADWGREDNGPWIPSVIPIQSVGAMQQGGVTESLHIENGSIGESVEPLTGHLVTDVEVLRRAYRRALSLQTPHTSSDCANCHLADAARTIGERDFGFTSGATVQEAARANETNLLQNLHAFGYYERSASVMQRTANESAEDAAFIDRHWPSN